ncbi:MAG: methionyl-tRNA formyltransferase, partial [Deltaproteobacteria bacterium]
MRVVFFGTPAFAVPALRALCADPARYQVVAAYTQPDRPAGRGRRLHSCAVKEAAGLLAVVTQAPTRLRDPAVQAAFAALRCDLAVVAAYGRILPPALLATPRLGCLNLHASLLPAYRGASPIAQAI